MPTTQDYRFTSSSYSHLEPVVPGTAMAGGPCDGLLVTTPGTATLTMADGVVVPNVPLQLGYNPFRIQMMATGATAGACSLAIAGEHGGLIDPKGVTRGGHATRLPF